MAQKLELKPCPFCGTEMKELSDLALHRCPKERSIELDCPPGNPRPDDLIEGVIAGLGIVAKEPVSKFFGNWKWEFPEVSEERWTEIKPILKERVTQLYNQGTIRYGSW